MQFVLFGLMMRVILFSPFGRAWFVKYPG